MSSVLLKVQNSNYLKISQTCFLRIVTQLNGPNSQKIMKKTKFIKPSFTFPPMTPITKAKLIFVARRKRKNVNLRPCSLRDTGVTNTLLYERLVGSAVSNLVCADGHLLDALTPRNISLACFGVADLQRSCLDSTFIFCC